MVGAAWCFSVGNHSPNFSPPFALHTDGWTRGLGAVSSQEVQGGGLYSVVQRPQRDQSETPGRAVIALKEELTMSVPSIEMR